MESASSQGPPPRDLDLERRHRAARCVAAHLAELEDLLQRADATYRTVDGSAVAAELEIADTNTRYVVVRVAILVPEDGVARIESALAPAGFRRGEPTGDARLMRMARDARRRAVHVLVAGEDGEGDAAPGSPEAAVAWRRRLARIGAGIELTLARTRHRAESVQDVTERFEVQLARLRPR